MARASFMAPAASVCCGRRTGGERVLREASVRVMKSLDTSERAQNEEP